MNREYKQTVQLLWIQVDSVLRMCVSGFWLCFQFMIAMTQTSTVPRRHVSKPCCNLDREGLSAFYFIVCKASE